MNIATIRRTFAAVCATAVWAVSPACAWEANVAAEEDEPDIHSEIVEIFAHTFPAAHYSHQTLDDHVSAMAWTNFIAALDYERLYFVKSDIDGFEKARDSIDDMLFEGDLSFAREVLDVYRKRVAERETFVTNLLASAIDLSVDEEYSWKRKDAPWAASTEELDNLWRLRIKNEYLARILADEAASNKAAKAAAKVEVEAEKGEEQASPAEPDAAVETAEEAPAEDADASATADASESEPADAPAPIKKLTPQESIAKRYRQLAIFVNDHDDDWLVERFLCAVAAAYDPHSDYMAPASVDDFNIDMNLSLCGIGATLSSEDGAAKIIDIIPGGPADRDERKIRLRVGDKIIGVGQGDEPLEDILHLPLSKAVQKIRGEKGTKVVLSVINDTDPNGRLVDLIRDEIKLEEQAATGHVERVTLNGDIERPLGVVRLPAFYGSVNIRPNTPGFRSCTYDVAKIIADMNNENIEGLVLDLRDNGGGSLREAIMLVGLFIRHGPVVQVRELRGTQQLQDRDPAVAFRKPMVVLVNRLSASASEIAAGALQDYGRAIVIGDSSTHGKGTVQTVMQLAADDAFGSMKATTATFYRITGASTQLRGVTPDIVFPSVYDYMELGEANLPNALPWTEVFSSEYDKVADLGPYIPDLAKASEARRAESESFQRYLKQVDLARQLQDRKSLPLQIDARRALDEADRALRKEAYGEDDEEDADDEETSSRRRKNSRKKDDPVLDEALNILSDLVDKQGNVELFPPVNTRQQRLQELMRRIFE